MRGNLQAENAVRAGVQGGASWPRAVGGGGGQVRPGQRSSWTAGPRGPSEDLRLDFLTLLSLKQRCRKQAALFLYEPGAAIKHG